MKKLLFSAIFFAALSTQAQIIEMNMDTPDGPVNMGVNVQEDPDGGVIMNMEMNTPGGKVSTGVNVKQSGSMQTQMNVEEDMYEEPVQEVVYDKPRKSSGCGFAMGASDFNSLKSSLSAQQFEDSKLTIAKQALSGNCLNANQVRELAKLFTYEENKLEIVKACYPKTTDQQNFYKVNDVFTYSSSVDELNSFINSRGGK